MRGSKRSILLLVLSATILTGQTAETFATGLRSPQRLLFTAAGNLVVSEGGTPTPNTGRLSIVDPNGVRRTLIEGLPSGPAHYVFPFGPTGMALDGRTLYLLIGEGDVMAGTPPNYGINLNGPSSPVFSSLLAIEFSRDLDQIAGGFQLENVHHWGLLDGNEVLLKNASDEEARVTLVTAFRPLAPNVLGGDQKVRPSDPYSLLLDSNKHFLYIADASAETISRVDARTGRLLTLHRFVPQVRDTPDGPVAVDTVPTTLCWWDGKLLVGNLSAGPFPRGEAMVRMFDPETREMQVLQGGFTAITDIACGKSSDGGLRLFVAEFTNDLSSPTPTGRVLVHAAGASRVITAGIVPIGVAVHPVTGYVYIALFGGRIVRAPAD